MADQPVEALRVRRSIGIMWGEYENGQREPIEMLIRAWRGIQALPSDNEHSMFVIGGFHGAPFRGAGYARSGWWGGYCHHGNVLFPPWHRAYCIRMENALRSIPGCETVTLPFLDVTSTQIRDTGLPEIFTRQEFELDGERIPNPLYSYTLPARISDHITGEKGKPAGYKTCRYPYSGLAGEGDIIAASTAHNATFSPEDGTQELNSNLMNWLDQKDIEVMGKNGEPDYWPTGTRAKFKSCLDAPNYTVFSNNTSASAWNDLHSPEEEVTPLESPHDDIHLALGGFDLPGNGPDKRQVFSHIAGANGDMGDNDTAGFDPIFFFHHANIDRVFWEWQKKQGCTTHYEIIPEYPGTNSVDEQGPTPGIPTGVWLDLDMALEPFKKEDGTPYRSTDTFHIENQMNYTYEQIPPDDIEIRQQTGAVRVSGYTKSKYAGSHLIALFKGKFSSEAGTQAVLRMSRKFGGRLPTEAEMKGADFEFIGHASVLSRVHSSECANCLVHDDVVRHIPIYGLTPEQLSAEGYTIFAKVITHDTSGKSIPDYKFGVSSGDINPDIRIIGPGQLWEDVEKEPAPVSRSYQRNTGATRVVPSSEDSSRPETSNIDVLD